MVEIPITRKSTNWLAWIALLLGIVALLWFIFGNDRDVDEAYVAPAVAPTSETTAPMTTGDAGINNGVITSLAQFQVLPAAGADGRAVNLDHVTAGDVTGDAAFWVSDSVGHRAYVVLNEVRTPGTAVEGQVDVDAGDKISVAGVVQSENSPAGAAIGTPTDPLPAGVTNFIYAETVIKLG